EDCRGGFQRLAGDGASVVASVGRRRSASERAVGSFESSSSLAAAARAELERAICACRSKTGWGPRLVAGATGFAHSTVWKVLKRAGISRGLRAAKEPVNRYEWPCPGDPLHMDTSRYARFLRPGHAVTGDRRRSGRLAPAPP